MQRLSILRIILPSGSGSTTKVARQETTMRPLNAILFSSLRQIPTLIVLLISATVSAQNWGLNCPLDDTTWVHAESGDTLQVTKHCLDNGRCYFLYVPSCATANVPLVMVLHGRSGCPFEVDDSTRWGRLATNNCFVTAYPEVSTGY